VSRLITIGAKVSPELALAVDRAILSDPLIFKDRSDFIRAAIQESLKQRGFLGTIVRPVNLQTPPDRTSIAAIEASIHNRKEKLS
jgi:Arc/MetJ-type ribon-helix-helix transcriptional regulator